ncbi:MAG: TraR/DksA family transcriptional regulator [Candidatus Paceibacteria bacterium]
MISARLKKELEKALLQEKAKIEEELGQFAKKDPLLAGDYDTIFPQFGERAASQDENIDEVEEYDKRLGLEHALEARLKEVVEALERIKTKEYGKCIKCGRQIPKERLRANPAATTCLRE